ncbi:MAG: glycosyltransferase [Paracoccaceae bacterium]
MLRVDIGVFAHDEADGIAAMIAGLARQDILTDAGIDARVLLLANGCTDDTATLARAAAFPALHVEELPQGGKSRTWNRFVHDLSRQDADLLVFCDADIALPQPDALSRLVRGLAHRPALQVLNSRPVKDIAYRPEGLSFTDRLISAGGGGLDDWKTAICGQLYAMPAAAARRFHLPVGLPVEDGFLRAMVLTDALTEEGESLGRIDGLDDLFHVYASERSIRALIRHQTRIVVGSAVNAACFAHLRRLPANRRHAELERAARDADWLSRVLRAELPRAPFGYVPLHFLTKRVVRAAEAPRESLRPKRAMTVLLGAGFDLIVYLAAQIRMARGTGAGFW